MLGGGAGGLVFFLTGVVLEFFDHGLAHVALAVMGEHQGAVHAGGGEELAGGEAPEEGGFQVLVVPVLAVELGDYFSFRPAGFLLGEGLELGEGCEPPLVKKSEGSP